MGVAALVVFLAALGVAAFTVLGLRLGAEAAAEAMVAGVVVTVILGVFAAFFSVFAVLAAAAAPEGAVKMVFFPVGVGGVSILGSGP